MMETNKQHTIPNILINLAHLLGTEIKNRRLEIPEKFGRGYCAGFIFNENIRMVISDYELNEDLVVENPEVNTSKKIIFFKFKDIFAKTEVNFTEKHGIKMPSVLIATSRINTDDIISIHTNTATINIEVDAEYLSRLVCLSEKSTVLENLIQNKQPLIFEQLIIPSLQKIVDEILTEKIDEALELFFLRIKAEELICRLLMELTKRNEKHIYALNIKDIQTIFKIKEQILMYPEMPPIIKDLAMGANMSPTKLKRLFKQVFGNSIFNYYQEYRMKEAARLLKEEKLSVSDVGYSLGFSNLSHFTRVFERHIGMKPKKYSMS